MGVFACELISHAFSFCLFCCFVCFILLFIICLLFLLKEKEGVELGRWAYQENLKGDGEAWLEYIV